MVLCLLPDENHSWQNVAHELIKRLQMRKWADLYRLLTPSRIECRDNRHVVRQTPACRCAPGSGRGKSMTGTLLGHGAHHCNHNMRTYGSQTGSSHQPV